MKEYIPQYVGTVTKYVFVDSPDTTPQDIATAAYEIAQGVMIKETCFGCQITGDPKDVAKIVAHLRNLDRNRIFKKTAVFRRGIHAGVVQILVVPVRGILVMSLRCRKSVIFRSGLMRLTKCRLMS